MDDSAFGTVRGISEVEPHYNNFKDVRDDEVHKLGVYCIEGPSSKTEHGPKRHVNVKAKKQICFGVTLHHQLFSFPNRQVDDQ